MKKPGRKLAEGRTAEVFAWGDDQVLKLYNQGWPRKTAEFEYRQALASQQTGYRVPQVGGIIELDARVGVIYQRMDGETMLAAMEKRAYRFPYFARLMADLHAEMHTKPAGGMETVYERLAWKISDAEGLTQGEKNTLHKHLDSLPRGEKLLHGDFHPGNILLTPDSPVIIDWIDATRGHPLADVARTVVIGKFGVPPEMGMIGVLFRQMIRIYLRRYFRQSVYPRADLDPWLLVVAAGRLNERIPHEQDGLLTFVRSHLHQ